MSSGRKFDEVTRDDEDQFPPRLQVPHGLLDEEQVQVATGVEAFGVEQEVSREMARKTRR